MSQKLNENLCKKTPAYKIFSKFYAVNVTDAEIAKMLNVNRSTVCRMKKMKSDDKFGKNGIIDYKYHALLKKAAKKFNVKLTAKDFLYE